MDCLEFRRLLGSDPRVADRAAREHLETCPFCTDAHTRAQAFEGRLAAALAVAVPADLADRLLLAQLTQTRQRERSGRKRFAWIALAAAASLVVAVGVVRQQRAAADTLPDLVAAHVTAADEHAALSLRAPLADADVAHAFADRGVHLWSAPQGVAYVSECRVGAYATVHMVMPRDDQPVSVVYVPKHRIANGGNFQRDGLQGREVPLADGTLVMLAQSSASFDALEHSWRGVLEGPADIGTGSN